MTYTKLEVTVFNALLDLHYDDAYITCKELAAKTKLELATIKGVVGSLVKKDTLIVDGYDRPEEGKANSYKWVETVVPVFDGEAMDGFGCDEYTKEEFDSFKIKQGV